MTKKIENQRFISQIFKSKMSFLIIELARSRRELWKYLFLSVSAPWEGEYSCEKELMR